MSRFEAKPVNKHVPETTMDDLLLGRTKELAASGDIERNWRGVLIALLVIMAVLSMILLSTILLSPPESGARITKPKIPISNFQQEWNFENNATWLSDTEIIFRNFDGGVSIMDILSLSIKQFLSNSTFRRLNASHFKISSDLNYILLMSNLQNIFKNTRKAFYHIYESATSVLQNVQPNFTFLSHENIYLNYFEWSPVNSSAVFIYNNDIYFMNKPYETSIRLTDTGSNEIYNGVPDFIYQEEITKDEPVIWFSPNALFLAFLTFNDSQVGQLNYDYYDEFQYYSTVENISFPKPGTINPDVTLQVVNLKNINNTKKIIVKIEQPKLLNQAYFLKFKWITDKKFLTVWTNRNQNLTIFTICNLLFNNSCNCEDIWLEKPSEGSLNDLDIQLIIINSTAFYAVLPIYNDRNGLYNQICLIKDGVKTALTNVQLSITKLLTLDNENRYLYFEACSENKPTQKHLYRLYLENSTTDCLTCPAYFNINSNITDLKPDEENWPIKSPNCLISKANLNVNAKYCILECLGPDVPSVHLIELTTNKKLISLNSAENLRHKYESYSMPQIKVFQVELDEGYLAQIKLQLPPGLREYEDLTFPLVLKVSFKPGCTSVDYRWNIDYASYLASTKNFIVAEIDTRGSSCTDRRHTETLRRRIGNLDAQDVLTVMRYLKTNVKFVDGTKVALYGNGYGGYLTGMILAQDFSLFKCGVSINGISSWQHYNSVWTERWLSNVTENYHTYQMADLTKRMGNLRNKTFLWIHGTADRSVPFQHSMFLAQAAIKEGVVFKTLTYPNEDHDLSGVQYHLFKILDQFFYECFGEPMDLSDWEIATGNLFKF